MMRCCRLRLIARSLSVFIANVRFLIDYVSFATRCFIADLVEVTSAISAALRLRLQFDLIVFVLRSDVALIDVIVGRGQG